MFSPTDMNNLVQNWFDIASRGSHTTTDERISLYEKTEKIAAYFDQQKANPEMGENEKVAALAKGILEAFSQHEWAEARLLGEWVGHHTMPDKSGGAFVCLHHLFNSIKGVSDEPTRQQKTMLINFLEYVASEKIENKELLLPKMSEVEPALLSQMPLQTLLAYRAVSKDNKEVADKILAGRLKRNETSFKDLRIRTLQSTIAFLGEACSLIEVLEVENPEELDQHLFQSIYSPRNFWSWFSTTIVKLDKTGEQLTKNFPNLRTLSLDLGFRHHANNQSQIEIHTLKLSQLEDLSIDCEAWGLDLSFAQQLPKLRSLILKEVDELLHLDLLKHCPLLEVFDCSCTKGSSDLNCLKNCLGLKQLCLRSYSTESVVVKDWSILQQLTKLEKIHFDGEITDPNFIKFLPPSLKSITCRPPETYFTHFDFMQNFKRYLEENEVYEALKKALDDPNPRELVEKIFKNIPKGKEVLKNINDHAGTSYKGNQLYEQLKKDVEKNQLYEQLKKDVEKVEFYENLLKECEKKGVKVEKSSHISYTCLPWR